MKIIDMLKGAWNRMFSSSNIENAIHVKPAISSKMKAAIELWEDMYINESPWLNQTDGTHLQSLGLPGMIASEKARTATIEMEIKVTGESTKAEIMKNTAKELMRNLRPNLEIGIALGGFVIKPYVTMGPDNKYKVALSYVKATNFYPMSFSSDGKVTEACFLDTVIQQNTVYYKLEYHKLNGLQLTVKNMAFRAHNNTQNGTFANIDLGSPVLLTEVSEWANIAPQVIIDNIDSLFFAYFKMPEANTVDLNSPLGVSGFSKAVDLIADADAQYSNLLWEFEGGQLAIDVDVTALNPKFGDGKEATLPKLQQRLYRHSLDLGDDNLYNVFSPKLRESEITNGLNTILTRIEDVCAISRGTLSQVTYSEARTATELRILKQRSFAANQDIQKSLQTTLEQVFNIVDKYCDLYEIATGDYEIAYKWDDSIIVDKDAERQVDMMDVNAGILSKVEYRMKWMGETEKQAEEAIKKCNDEKIEQMSAQQEVMMKSAENVADATKQTSEQNKQGLQKANDSKEVKQLTENDDDKRKSN